MTAIEQRILGHAVAAGVVRAGSPMTSLAAEGAAWTAQECASALAAGVEPHRVVAELGESLGQAGASAAEIVFVQFVVAEVFSIAHRLALEDEDVDLEEEIQCRFRWTKSPQADGGPRFFAELMQADDLSGSEREQSISIYLTAMLMAFGNRVLAFRAWALWAEAPESLSALEWSAQHARATQLAFAGLDAQDADVLVRFQMP